MKLDSLAPERARFSSGLRAIATPMPWVHRAVVTAYLRIGSRYENPAQNGISHFLEHMLFRGTPRHPSAHRLALAFENLGGTLVAATAADHGLLAIGVPLENLEPVLDLFGEVYLSPIIEELDVERGIVREEILEDLDEDGQVIDGATLVRKLAFGEHGLARPITGTIDTLETFSREALLAHHSRYYVADSSVISVAGPIDAERTLALIERTFGSIGRGAFASDEAAPPQDAPRFRHVQHPGSQTGIHLAFRGPGDHDAREPAVDMLLRVIDDGMATRLYHRLCDSRGLCYDAGASYEAYSETGLVELYTETAHERAAEVLNELLGLTEELAAHGPTPAEMERTLRRCRWQHEAMLDDPGDVADYLALAELTETAPTPRDRLAELSAVTRERVHEAAAHIFRPEGLSAVTVGRQSDRARNKLRERVFALRNA